MSLLHAASGGLLLIVEDVVMKMVNGNLIEVRAPITCKAAPTKGLLFPKQKKKKLQQTKWANWCWATKKGLERGPGTGPASGDWFHVDTYNVEGHKRGAHLQEPADAMSPPSAPSKPAYGGLHPPCTTNELLVISIMMTTTTTAWFSFSPREGMRKCTSYPRVGI